VLGDGVFLRRQAAVPGGIAVLDNHQLNHIEQGGHALHTAGRSLAGETGDYRDRLRRRIWPAGEECLSLGNMLLIRNPDASPSAQHDNSHPEHQRRIWLPSETFPTPRAIVFIRSPVFGNYVPRDCSVVGNTQPWDSNSSVGGVEIKPNVVLLCKSYCSGALFATSSGKCRSVKISKESTMEIRWLRVARDVIIVSVIPAIGGFLSLLAYQWKEIPYRMLWSVGTALNVFAFCFVGCLTPDHRWKHLLCVAIGVWLTSCIIVVFLPSTSFYESYSVAVMWVWFVGMVLGCGSNVFVAMGLGGVISYIHICQAAKRTQV